MTAYDAGPRLEPCTILADIDIVDDTPPLYTRPASMEDDTFWVSRVNAV